MSGCEIFVQCLICPEKVLVKDMLQHIHDHVNYKPLKCNDCNFWCINQNELDTHTLRHKHTGGQHPDPYKQWLVDGINKDTHFAAMNGLKALYKKKNIGGSVPPSTPVNASTSRTPPLNQHTHRRPVSSSPSRSPSPAASSSGEEEDTPPRTVKKTPPAVARRSDTRAQPDSAGKQRKNADDGKSDSDDKIEKYRQHLDKRFANCGICKRDIKITLDFRQDHIRHEHMNDVRPGPAYQLQLEQKTKEAFPYLVSNCRQCSKCDSFKELQGTFSRKGHVTKYHGEFFKPLSCPKKCGFSTTNTTAFTKHFEVSHGLPRNWKLFINDKAFLHDYTEHNRKVDEVVGLIFAVDLPLALNSEKRKKRTNDDDDEEDVQAFAEFRAIALSTPAVPKPSPKRRLSKPDDKESDDEEDSDSDDDEGANGQTVAAKRQLLASDKEAEDEQMNVDDKEEAKSGGGSSCSVVATIGSLKTEEDIKKEPRTRNTRWGPVASPNPTFTGRRPPLLASTPSIVPTGQEPRRQLRSDQQWNGRGGSGGMHRGGGGGVNRGRSEGPVGTAYRGGGPRLY